MRLAAIVAAALALVLTPGCSTPSLFIDEVRTLSPGEFIEYNFEMLPGDEMNADFQANYNESGRPARPVWDVHSHGPTGQVVVHDEGNEYLNNVRFRATEAGVYSLLIRLPPDAEGNATLDVRITGSATLQSVTP